MSKNSEHLYRVFLLVIIKIKKLRRDKGLTIRQLAEAASISKSHLGRIENNESMPAVDVLCDIAHALGVNPSETYEYHYTGG